MPVLARLRIEVPRMRDKLQALTSTSSYSPACLEQAAPEMKVEPVCLPATYQHCSNGKKRLWQVWQ